MVAVTTRRRVALVSVALLGLIAGDRPGVGAQNAPIVLTVDASTSLGAVNPDLVGVGWHPGGPPLDVVAPLRPRMVRIDASLQDVSPTPDELRLERLLGDVAEVRRIGGEPLVILSYMPAWLGAPNAHGRDPTKVPPADLDVWEDLVHDVVHALATAPAPARRFEAWNEPDIPIFWQDTPAAWSERITRTARAIARVEEETGLDLAFGGPATAVPDPAYLAAFLSPLRDQSLPLDFVSWHYYANTPFLGPDGNEFPATDPVHPVVGQRYPLASPAAYGTQVEMMREWTAAALAGTDRPEPALTIDEWNLSAGGFDHRHDTHEGAAFAAAVLMEMQEAGLDQSAFFQVSDAPSSTGQHAYGGHGLVHFDGTRKPAWWAQWLWHQQAGGLAQVTGADSTAGLWAMAAGDSKRVTVLVTSFSASRPTARTVDVVLAGLPWRPARATVRRLDAAHADAVRKETLAVEGFRVRLDLPAQAVALVEVRPRR